MKGYIIQFTVPGGGCFFAGDAPDGTLGYATLLEGAKVYESREIAERFLANGYGPSMAEIGKVIPYSQAGPDSLRKMFQL